MRAGRSWSQGAGGEEELEPRADDHQDSALFHFVDQLGRASSGLGLAGARRQDPEPVVVFPKLGEIPPE